MKDSQNLTSNIQGIDSGDQFNFKCPYCKRNLSSRQNLKEHMYTHTGTKPYVCKQPGCGREFRQGSLLSIHKKMHKEVKEGMGIAKVAHKKIEYPKLTRLIGTDVDRAQFVLNDFERRLWMERIGESEFQFLRKFLE